MIKDYQNKEILAAMKHQLNAAAKKSVTSPSVTRAFSIKTLKRA